MSALTTSETLNLAADLIEERGWARGNCAMQTTGPTCLEGAIGAAINASTRPPYTCDSSPSVLVYGYSEIHAHPAYKAIVEHLGVVGWVWNDSRSRTQAEVIAVLRATAVIESAREVRTTLPGLPGSEVPA